MDAILAIVAAAGCAASAEDLWRGRVSNWTPAAAFVAALVVRIARHGARGAAEALWGAALGFLIFFVFHWLGGLGGGDVKLMAAFGAALGPQSLCLAAAAGAVLGAIHALVAACFRARTIPYAPALSLGAVFAALGRSAAL